MNRLISRNDATDSVLFDARIRFFQEFITVLLNRLPQLENITEQENIELFHKELLTKLVEERARSEKIFGEEPFLILCGVADELLQNAEWVGRDWWKTHLLELSIFGTRTIGDQFYLMIHRILAERKSKDLPLAVILLDSLAIGFRGRFAIGADDETQRALYRSELGSWIQSACEHEERINQSSETSFSTDQTQTTETIPSLTQWWLCVILLAICLLLTSHGIWYKNIMPLRDFQIPTALNAHSIIGKEGGK